MLQENCFVVSDESDEAVIIDCGAYYPSERQAIVNYISEQQLKPVHLLATHGHFDHNFGNDTIWDAYGLKPQVCQQDLPLMDLHQQSLDMLGISYDRPVPPVGRFLSEGDIVTFGSHQLSVIATPGHTPGSATFYCEAEQVAFSGDTLFRMSIGRTDLPGGNWSQLGASLQRLAQLPASTKVYCGHGPATSIGDELRYNPYMTSKL